MSRTQTMTVMEVLVGKRIRLTQMVDDPLPLEVGAVGTVESVTRLLNGEHQVCVDWDNGRTLHLIHPIDKFETLA
jgi:archaellum component FlaG (FlaF/FlaG flagellin family)